MEYAQTLKFDWTNQAKQERKKMYRLVYFGDWISIEHPNDDVAIIVYKNMVWVASQHGLWKKS